LARRARGPARRRCEAEARHEPAPRLRREERTGARGTPGRSEDRRVALRRVQGALRAGARPPRRVRRRIHRRADPRPRPRLLHADDVRVHRAGRELAGVDDLRRRTVRLPRRGDRRAADVGRRMSLAGWVDTRRDHGGLVFIDLRDYSGKVQLVINPERAAEAAQTAHEIRNEFVLQAEGEVVRRAPEAVNPNIPTGEIEVQVDTLRILSRSDPLPFQIGDDVDEVLRLRYRWLDLRSDRMQRNLRLSHTIVAAIRRQMDELDFVDVWTPSMTKGTPEGARDFLVPVRLQPGRFFALAQSPQLFKQLTMVGGFDRYYQIATCWRDEDLRADRQFEFRQLDFEMSFVDREDVLEVMERAVVASFEGVGREVPPTPFPRLTYEEVISRYGTDKPDLRYGLAIEDATEVTRDSQFGVFAGAPVVRYIVAPQA